MIERDLIDVAAERGITDVPRDHLALRWTDGTLIIWSGPADDPNRVVVREVPAAPPWGRK